MLAVPTFYFIQKSYKKNDANKIRHCGCTLCIALTRLYLQIKFYWEETIGIIKLFILAAINR